KMHEKTAAAQAVAEAKAAADTKTAVVMPADSKQQATPAAGPAAAPAAAVAAVPELKLAPRAIPLTIDLLVSSAIFACVSSPFPRFYSGLLRADPHIQRETVIACRWLAAVVPVACPCAPTPIATPPVRSCIRLLRALPPWPTLCS